MSIYVEIRAPKRQIATKFMCVHWIKCWLLLAKHYKFNRREISSSRSILLHWIVVVVRYFVALALICRHCASFHMCMFMCMAPRNIRERERERKWPLANTSFHVTHIIWNRFNSFDLFASNLKLIVVTFELQFICSQSKWLTFHLKLWMGNMYNACETILSKMIIIFKMHRILIALENYSARCSMEIFAFDLLFCCCCFFPSTFFFVYMNCNWAVYNTAIFGDSIQPILRL